MVQADSSLASLSLLAYCFFFFSLTSPIAAEDVSLTGTWRHKASKAEAAELDEAIDGATQGIGPLVRGRAREHLREATQPWKELTLTIEDRQLTFSSNDRTMKMTIDGPVKQVSGERGAGTMQARYKDGKLCMIAVGEAGTRTTVFHIAEDGKRLTLEVSLDSQKLVKPIRYRETYVPR